MNKAEVETYPFVKNADNEEKSSSKQWLKKRSWYRNKTESKPKNDQIGEVGIIMRYLLIREELSRQERIDSFHGKQSC